VTADDVQRWLDAYIAAWASYDEADIAALFTEDAEYRYDAFRKPLVGSAAIAASWLKHRDAPGSWEAEYRPSVVEDNRAVAVGETRYPQEGKRYRNLYELEFAPDGRCRSFTEWYLLERGARH
jgi:hypothetical protein